MTSAQLKEFNQVIVDTQKLLKSKREWENRFSGYANDISNNLVGIRSVRSTFRECEPLKLYLTTTNAKTKSNSYIFNLRFLGQSVADIRSNKNGLKIFTTSEQIKKNNTFFKCNVTLSKADWGGDVGKEFRRFFKQLTVVRNIGNEEHRLESLLLTEFEKKQSNSKKIIGIQPVKIAGIRFPMPTPISASNHKNTKYSGIHGGNIDILTRVGTGGRATNLCIMELKDENKKSEPPTDAIKQAIAYATFTRELLRSDSGPIWWKLFGFGGKIPKELVLFAACVMPSNANNDCSFVNVPLDIVDSKGEDKIVLHYVYFEEQGNKIIKVCTSL